MTRKGPARQVLVAVDGSPGSDAAVRAAALMARLFDAELAGLYVEEDRVLVFCESPLAHEVELLTASGRKSDRREVERQFRAQAIRARRAVQRAAEPERVSWSFRVVRGTVSAEVLAAAAGAELVAVGRCGRSLRHPGTLGGTISTLVSERRGAVVVVAHDRVISPPVRLLYAEGETPRRALALAAKLAAEMRGALVILATEPKQEELLRSARDELRGSGPPVRCVGLGEISRGELVAYLCGQRRGLLVLPLSSTALGAEDLRQLVRRARCPVLAVS